jgi:hypothetical protein
MHALTHDLDPHHHALNILLCTCTVTVATARHVRLGRGPLKERVEKERMEKQTLPTEQRWRAGWWVSVFSPMCVGFGYHVCMLFG